jgi:hypothetical protein
MGRKRPSLWRHIGRYSRTLGLAAAISALILITLVMHSLAQTQLRAELDGNTARLASRLDRDTMLSIIDPTYTITFTASPGRIPVNGETSLLTATVTDLFRSPVPDGTQVRFETNLGMLGSPAVTKTTVSGVATATLTSGGIAGTAHLTATVGNDHDYTTVEFFWYRIGLPFVVKNYLGD